MKNKTLYKIPIILGIKKDFFLLDKKTLLSTCGACTIAYSKKLEMYKF